MSNSRGQVAHRSPEIAGKEISTDGLLFAKALLGRPSAIAEVAPRVPVDRRLLEWLAGISTRHERELRNVLREEASASERGQSPEAIGEDWDEAKHPRLGGPPNAGWFASAGDSGSAVSGDSDNPPKPDGLVRQLPRGAQFLAQTFPMAQPGGVASSAWPTVGAAGSVMPKIDGATAAGAKGAAIGAAGAAAGASRNAAMVGYWSNVPGVQAMPKVWAYELEKRVQAGKLSREDARGIFYTAMLGAEAQGFKPTGNTSAAVHQSMVDFLAKAEAVYFTRKKTKEEGAKKAGAYQQSGGRVFPTEQNSGLKGAALRKEQEDFFERGLREGKDPGYLRGQAATAGSPRAGGLNMPNDRIVDEEAEAALQRAIEKIRKTK